MDKFNYLLLFLGAIFFVINKLFSILSFQRWISIKTLSAPQYIDKYYQYCMSIVVGFLKIIFNFNDNH